jgi:hypothetical protein
MEANEKISWNPDFDSKLKGLLIHEKRSTNA